MKRIITVIAFVVVALPSAADYGVFERGVWPKDWPKEMDSLRDQATTLEGPRQPSLHYAIPFTKREEFEAAWPHILKVKTKGAPIILRRGPNFFLSGGKHGVCIHTPPKGTEPKEGDEFELSRLETTNYIELIVDGEIVDLNRIPLPPDTPIIDERFKDEDLKR